MIISVEFDDFDQSSIIGSTLFNNEKKAQIGMLVEDNLLNRHFTPLKQAFICLKVMLIWKTINLATD